MSIAWHAKRCWSFWISVDEKKEIKPILLGGCKNIVNIGYFGAENCVWFMVQYVLNQFSIEIIHKDLIEFKIFTNFGQNISILPDQIITQGAKCFNTPYCRMQIDQLLQKQSWSR